MPFISSFFGIYIRMYFDDHPPPHIHVEYQGHKALVGIASSTAHCRGARNHSYSSGASTTATNWSRIGTTRRRCCR
jgi:hypothetical protein